MGRFKVLFFISAITVAYVGAGRSPGQSFGSSKEGTKELVGRQFYLSRDVVVKFNNSKKHDITIDKVDIKYEAGKASCRIVSGGPDKEYVNVRVTLASRGITVRTTVMIYGRLNNGYNQKELSPDDITYQ